MSPRIVLNILYIIMLFNSIVLSNNKSLGYIDSEKDKSAENGFLVLWDLLGVWTSKKKYEILRCKKN